MSSNRTGVVGNGLLIAILASAVCLAALAPSRAAAQCSDPSPLCQQVSPDGKGMIGLGLIGLELGFAIPALVQHAARTNEWWPYLVFPAVGAIGGVVGGYFMEQETQRSPEVDVVFLAVGVALVVPTVVLTLALTAYDPARDAVSAQDGGGEDPVLEDGTSTDAQQVEQVSVRTRRSDPMAGGPGLLRFDGAGRQLLLGVPMISRRATFTAAETAALRLAPATDVHVPLVSATF